MGNILIYDLRSKQRVYTINLTCARWQIYINININVRVCVCVIHNVVFIWRNNVPCTGSINRFHFRTKPFVSRWFTNHESCVRIGRCAEGRRSSTIVFFSFISNASVPTIFFFFFFTGATRRYGEKGLLLRENGDWWTSTAVFAIRNVHKYWTIIEFRIRLKWSKYVHSNRTKIIHPFNCKAYCPGESVFLDGYGVETLYKLLIRPDKTELIIIIIIAQSAFWVELSVVIRFEIDRRVIVNLTNPPLAR